MLQRNYDSVSMLIAFVSGLVLSIIFNPLVGLFVLLLTACSLAMIQKRTKIKLQTTSKNTATLPIK